MSTPKQDTFVSIEPDNLEKVAGGLSRSSSNDQLTQMLTQITSSIKDLASKNNQSDPTQLLLIMMMMGGIGGGGGGGVIAGGPAVAAGPPVINVDTGVSGGWGGPIFGGGGGYRRGKK